MFYGNYNTKYVFLVYNFHNINEKYIFVFSGGAFAERVNFKAMLIYASFNIFIFILPAHWMWSDIGFLRYLGARDAAGSGVVHLTGGFSGTK